MGGLAAPRVEAEEWGSSAGCIHSNTQKYCQKICQEGLGRSEKQSYDCDGGWIPLTGACYVHAFATENPYGVSQGDYMQKCMKEYCIAKENGPCEGSQCSQSKNWWSSFLSKSQRVKKHG